MPRPEAVVATMFVVVCPKCGKQSKAFVDHAGYRGKCPHCGKKIRIVARAGVVPAEELARIEPLPRSMPRKRRARVRLSDTSPPAVPLALLAAYGTWLCYYYGNQWAPGSGWEEAWKILLSCLWVGRAEVFLFLWGLALVFGKAGMWLYQRRYLNWQVFPDPFGQLAQRVQPNHVDQCLAHLRGLSRRPERSILLNRVCLALEHLRQTRNVSEVRGALTGQSAIDANLLDSSYSLLRFLVWVIPIFGFIGTVVGIGIAVKQFAGFIPQVSEMEQAMESIRNGLGQVTAGLATAFNTTLVGLCLVAPLMLLTSWLRKLEERLLAQVDHFSNHQLLAALDDRE